VMRAMAPIRRSGCSFKVANPDCEFTPFISKYYGNKINHTVMRAMAPIRRSWWSFEVANVPTPDCEITSLSPYKLRKLIKSLIL
jgi:hypothetical protein